MLQMASDSKTTTELLCAVLRQAERDVCYWRACAERRAKRERQLMERLQHLEQTIQAQGQKREREAPDTPDPQLEPGQVDSRDLKRYKELTKDHEEVLDAYYERAGIGIPMGIE